MHHTPLRLWPCNTCSFWSKYSFILFSWVPNRIYSSRKNSNDNLFWFSQLELNSSSLCLVLMIILLLTSIELKNYWSGYYFLLCWWNTFRSEANCFVCICPLSPICIGHSFSCRSSYMHLFPLKIFTDPHEYISCLQNISCNINVSLMVYYTQLFKVFLAKL